jgi:hypothetical protein
MDSSISKLEQSTDKNLQMTKQGKGNCSLRKHQHTSVRKLSGGQVRSTQEVVALEAGVVLVGDVQRGARRAGHSRCSYCQTDVMQMKSHPSRFSTILVMHFSVHNKPGKHLDIVGVVIMSRPLLSGSVSLGPGCQCDLLYQLLVNLVRAKSYISGGL